MKNTELLNETSEMQNKRSKITDCLLGKGAIPFTIGLSDPNKFRQGWFFEENLKKLEFETTKTLKASRIHFDHLIPAKTITPGNKLSIFS